MVARSEGLPAIRVGDRAGYGSIYDQSGNLLGEPGESYIEVKSGWDMNVRSPWRRAMPKILFMGFNGKAVSRLYVTTDRIVLIREIDTWRELSGEMTLLGMPTAIAKEQVLKSLKAAGVRQFCELRPLALKLVSAKKYLRHGSRLDARVLDPQGRQYAVSFWKTDGSDNRTLLLIESQFRRR